MPAAIVPCVEVPFASIFTGMIRQPLQPAATTRATPVPWPWSSCVSTELSKTLRPAISPGTDGSTPGVDDGDNDRGRGRGGAAGEREADRREHEERAHVR